jgi:hypothetical protein
MATEFYVEYFFPGSFVSESSVRAIADREAVGDWPKGAYGRRTYAMTVTEVDGERVTGKPRDYSPTTFRGEALTVDQVKKYHPDERILISNMEGNGYDRICWTNGRAYPMNANDTCIPAAAPHQENR